MPELTVESKVIIIGAGLAGLALAQMLRKEDIEYEIYERDDGKRRQGWTLGLDKSTSCLQHYHEVADRNLDASLASDLCC